MQQRSNAYVIGFAAVVCLVCSIVVSTASVALRPRQATNKELDRKLQVLTVAGLIEAGQKVAPDDIGRLFDENIVARAVELSTGVYDESVDPVSYDQRKATRDPALSVAADPNAAGVRRLPYKAVVYHRMVDDEIAMLILPIEGAGLWSTLYGFIALATDASTIEGITFYEHGETPGLGGEVDNPSWKALWSGRQAFDTEGEIAIEVIKGYAGPPDQEPHKVDGISGATITARAVSYLVRFWLGEDGFGPYLDQFQAEQGAAS